MQEEAKEFVKCCKALQFSRAKQTKPRNDEEGRNNMSRSQDGIEFPKSCGQERVVSLAPSDVNVLTKLSEESEGGQKCAREVEGSSSKCAKESEDVVEGEGLQQQSIVAPLSEVNNVGKKGVGEDDIVEGSASGLPMHAVNFIVGKHSPKGKKHRRAGRSIHSRKVDGSASNFVDSRVAKRKMGIGDDDDMDGMDSVMFELAYPDKRLKVGIDAACLMEGDKYLLNRWRAH